MREIPQKERNPGLIFPIRCHSEARSAEESLPLFRKGSFAPLRMTLEIDNLVLLRTPANKTSLRAREPGGPSPRCHGEEDQKSGGFSARMKVTIKRRGEDRNEGNSSFFPRRHRSLSRSRSFAASASG